MAIYEAVITSTENYSNPNGVNLIDGTVEKVSDASTFNNFTNEEIIDFANSALLNLKRVIVTLENDENVLSQENPIYALRFLRTHVNHFIETSFPGETKDEEHLLNPCYYLNFDVLKVSLNQKNTKFYAPVATIRIPLISSENGNAVDNYALSEDEVVDIFLNGISEVIEQSPVS